jgi:predicted CXXCH cytochrome family protein
VWHSRLTRWIHGKREKLLWGVGGAAALAVILLSCSTTNRTILAPPSIPGAEFVGSEECATCHEEIVRDFRTSTHARLQRTRREIVNTSGGKGSEAKGSTTVKTSIDMGCESCHGPGSLHVKAGGGRGGTIINPRKSPETCFQCHLEVRAAFALPHHHPVLEGKMSCADCHSPHKGIAIKSGGTRAAEMGGTNIQQNLKAGGLAFLSRNETCFECHTQQRGPFVYEHEALRQGCVVCHSPHGSVNQRLLNERNATLCLKCHFQEQRTAGHIFIGDVDHSSFLQQGTCWSAGCHEEPHGSNVTPLLRY